MLRKCAANQGIARACDHVRPGDFRIEEGRHVLFFKIDPEAVLIVRVLHERMDPLLNLEDDDE